MSGKQELMVQSAGLPAPQELVKVDIKVNTSDMVDAMVFDSEELLRKERKDLLATREDLGTEYTKLDEKRAKLLVKQEKEFSDKKISALAKSMTDFLGKTVSIICNANIRNNSSSKKQELEMSVSLCSKETRRYYDGDVTHLSKTLVTELPKELSEVIKEMEKNRKDYTKNIELVNKVDDSIKELPHLKKRVKSTIVKNKVRQVKDGEQLIKAIESAIIEAAKKE